MKRSILKNYEILLIICLNRKQKIKQLNDKVSCFTDSTISYTYKLSKELVQKGLIKELKDDGDNRSKIIILTELGQELRNVILELIMKNDLLSEKQLEVINEK